LRPWDVELEEQGNQYLSEAYIDNQKAWDRYRKQWEPLQRAEELHGFGWYQEVYLKSDAWRQKRWRVLARANWFCEKCGNDADEVHHLTYERVGNELLSDLIALCRECHSKMHGKNL
jgi:hypothetical protein